jgi:hypothetical protein
MARREQDLFNEKSKSSKPGEKTKPIWDEVSKELYPEKDGRSK